ncbi:hypothetical protein VTL71DRAFT_14488 [Oculimacula yallundae]|uniref:Uncharacterized protein n=1 Tax=Oculimacula yallundae TaxID=86028 RepID=A0ABR4CJ59_9HELO
MPPNYFHSTSYQPSSDWHLYRATRVFPSPISQLPSQSSSHLISSEVIRSHSSLSLSDARDWLAGNLQYTIKILHTYIQTDTRKDYVCQARPGHEVSCPPLLRHTKSDLLLDCPLVKHMCGWLGEKSESNQNAEKDQPNADDGIVRKSRPWKDTNKRRHKVKVKESSADQVPTGEEDSREP